MEGRRFRSPAMRRPTTIAGVTLGPAMTLRDWYKGQALKGTDWRFMLEHSGDTRSTLARIAEECGMMADAMLAEGKEKS